VCIDEFWRGINVKQSRLMLDCDQMIAILSYSIFNGRLTDLHGQVKYIEEFTSNQVQNSKLGSALFTLKVSADNVASGQISIKHKKIVSNMHPESMQQFNEKMADVEDGDVGGTVASQDSSFMGGEIDPFLTWESESEGSLLERPLFNAAIND